MKEKKFNLSTKKGSWRLLALFIALMLVFAALSNVITTGGYRVQNTDITIDVAGYSKTFEIWRPVNVDRNDKLPCVIVSHGGSESMGCTSLYAWELARRGFVVINENMDGAAQSGQPNLDENGLGKGTYSRVSTAGHLDVLNYVRTISYVDPTRIAMWGHSQGNGTMGAALVADEEYFTINDRLLNVLYNDFGIEISEEQLTQDANEIAAEVLDDVQMAEYEILKAEQEKIVNRYLKFSRTGRTDIKATVAGHEVVRDLQMNMMISIGAHEGTGNLDAGTTDTYKASMHSTENVKIGGIYSMPDYTIDPEASATYVGTIFENTINNTPAMKEAIKNNSARFFCVPITIHNGWLWGHQAVSESIEFITQCLGYNNGELSDPATRPISTKNLTVGYSALVCTTLSFFSMIGMLMAIASLLLKTPFFAICESPCYAPKMKNKSKDMVMWIIVTAVVGFIGTWCCSQNDLSFKTSINTMTKLLPWEPAQIRMLFNVAGTAISGVVLFFVLSALVKKKDGEEPCLATLTELKLKAGWRRFFKTLLIGTLLFTAAYISACFINLFFDTRFLHVDGSYEPMTSYNFGRMFRYFIIYLPFCLVISTLNNMVTIKGVGEKADTAINVLVTSLGMIIFMVIGFAVTYSTPGHAEIFSLHAMLSIIFITPYCNYMYRKMFKLTGSVWAGAILVALFLAWRAAGYICMRFMWIGSNELAAFWGIYAGI